MVITACSEKRLSCGDDHGKQQNVIVVVDGDGYGTHQAVSDKKRRGGKRKGAATWQPWVSEKETWNVQPIAPNTNSFNPCRCPRQANRLRFSSYNVRYFHLRINDISQKPRAKPARHDSIHCSLLINIISPAMSPLSFLTGNRIILVSL